MMNRGQKVVSLADAKARRDEKKENEAPHFSGPAACLACKHEWVAVAPAGTVWLECPKCGTERGVMKGPCMHFGEDHWTCECGNILFHITKHAIYCPMCGKPQKGF